MFEMELKLVDQGENSNEFKEYYKIFKDYLNLQIFIDFHLKHRLKVSLAVEYIFLQMSV